jgi:hypothetical protein
VREQLKEKAGAKYEEIIPEEAEASKSHQPLYMFKAM